jgi:hypothetical protein
MRHSSLAAAAFSAAAFLAFMPEAAACGGTFCDVGPTAMPVDQTGENVLFVMNDEGVEAHIQIQYQGEADKFAWVIPVQQVPEFEVGSQLLFRNLLAGSVPRYGYTTTRDVCETNASNNRAVSAGAPTFDSAPGESGPSVVLRKAVGAFEVVVLSGGSAAEVSDWLADNGYQQSDQAPALLDDYVRAGFVFVAVKLRGGAGIDEIHPLVIRYAGGQPCVPLKLTAVAAVENMGVRTFFLGHGRVVPKTYKHFTLNQARIDWLRFGANYTEVISRAADSPLADGRAFVTEYAGPSSIVSSAGVFSPAWDASRFVAIEPELVIGELQSQGLVDFCDGSTCSYPHPLIQPLLHQYLPVPAGMTEGAFYGCLSCASASIDASAWDAAGFAADFEDRIAAPGRRAAALLADNPYHTRMFTTISPAEMIADPEFHERADLPEVPLPGLATRRILCNDVNVFTLPDGRSIVLPSSSSPWPTISEDMPWAETIEEIPEAGPPIVLADHRARIGQDLKAYNDSQVSPASGCGCRAAPRTSGAPGLALGLALGLWLSSRRRAGSRARR